MGVILEGFGLSHLRGNMCPKMYLKMVHFEVPKSFEIWKMRVQYPFSMRGRFLIDFWRVRGRFWGSSWGSFGVLFRGQEGEKREAVDEILRNLDSGSVLGRFREAWGAFGEDFVAEKC